MSYATGKAEDGGHLVTILQIIESEVSDRISYGESWFVIRGVGPKFNQKRWLLNR